MTTSAIRRRSATRTRRPGLVLLAGALLVAAACGGSDDDAGDDPSDVSDVTTDTAATDTTADAGESATTEAPTVSENAIEQDTVDDDADPVPGGTLRYGIEADVDGLNPTTSALSAPGQLMANAVFDNITAYDVDNNAVPYLAEIIEPVDGDLSTWQVTLREGITFHDGTPLNAEAAQISFDTQLQDPLIGLQIRPFFPETGATEIVDELSLRYNLLEPFASFPAFLATRVGYVASPTWLAAALEDPTLNQQPVGTGPFVFESRSADSVTRFARNEDWWNGEVLLDALEFVPVTDGASRVDLFVNGELDAMHVSTAEYVGELLEEDGVQNIIDETGEDGFYMLNAETPPFDDVRARQALTYAFPLQAYRDLQSAGVSRPADQMFIPESRFYDPSIVQEGDQPDLAAELATEYCAERGDDENPLLGTPTCTDGRINIEYQFAGPSALATRIAEFLDQSLSPVFNLTFDEVAQDDTIQEAALGQYNLVGWRQFGDADPALERLWLLCRNVGPISLNWPRYCDTERDELLLEAGALEPDDPARVPLFQAISKSMQDAYTYVFTLHTPWDNAFAENVRGVCDRMSPDGIPLRCALQGYTYHDSVWFAG